MAMLYLQLAHDHRAARDLLALVDMMNQAVGDALSGLLFVEAALRRLKYSLGDWAALYTNLPSRQLKVENPSDCHPLGHAVPPGFLLFAHTQSCIL